MNVYNIHCKVIRIQVQMRLRQFSVLKPEGGETLTNHTRNAQTINQYDIDDIIVLSLHKKKLFSILSRSLAALFKCNFRMCISKLSGIYSASIYIALRSS